SNALRRLRFRLALLPGGEDLAEEPGHGGRERDHAGDEGNKPDQAEDGSHHRPRIATCPAHASSCWTQWARAHCPTPLSSATRAPTRSATSRGPWAASICPTSRRSASGTSSR